MVTVAVALGIALLAPLPARAERLGPFDPSGPPAHRPVFPGDLLIADRGNGRILLVDAAKRILWRYPSARRAPSYPFRFDDDTFFSPTFRKIVSNQEDQQTVQVVSFPGGRVLWHYGHPNAAGSGPGYLHTPDDAYLLPGGTRAVADIGNCRVLLIAPDKHIVRRYGATGVCRHDPPRFLAWPNGDTPLADGSMLVTEIGGSWVDRMGPHGHLEWSVHTPARYPSDAQWLGHGRILLADYSRPGAVMVVRRSGRVLWRYGPPAGPGMLDHPSLALRLPNGLIAVNDDSRDRVVLIDPRTRRIVWQFGHTDAPGSVAGRLDTPDGLDYLPRSRVPARLRTP